MFNFIHTYLIQYRRDSIVFGCLSKLHGRGKSIFYTFYNPPMLLFEILWLKRRESVPISPYGVLTGSSSQMCQILQDCHRHWCWKTQYRLIARPEGLQRTWMVAIAIDLPLRINSTLPLFVWKQIWGQIEWRDPHVRS